MFSFSFFFFVTLVSFVSRKKKSSSKIFLHSLAASAAFIPRSTLLLSDLAADAPSMPPRRPCVAACATAQAAVPLGSGSGRRWWR